MNKVLSLAFVAICALFFLMNFAPEKEFSDTENRKLSSAPEFSFKALFSDKYTAKFEAYIQDQFFARDFWVKLKNENELALQKKDSGGTYFATDGGYLEKKEAPKEGQLEKNIAFLNQFDTWGKSEGIHSSFLAIPSASTLYPEKLPAYAPYLDEKQLLETLRQQLGMTISDPLEALSAHAEESLYFNTDHHWTQRAAYYAYEELGEALGYVPFAMSDFKINTLDNFYGSLYSKAPHFGVVPDSIEYFVQDNITPTVQYPDHQTTDNTFYTTANFTIKDKYTLFLNGNNSEITLTTGAETGRTLLVAKDSFSHPLIPFLAPHFDAIHVVDLRYFNRPFSEYCTEKGVTDILFSYNLSWFADDTNIAKAKAKTK